MQNWDDGFGTPSGGPAFPIIPFSFHISLYPHTSHLGAAIQLLRLQASHPNSKPKKGRGRGWAVKNEGAKAFAFFIEEGTLLWGLLPVSHWTEPCHMTFLVAK